MTQVSSRFPKASLIPAIPAWLSARGLRDTRRCLVSSGHIAWWGQRMYRFPGGLKRKLSAGQPFRFEDAWEKSGEKSLPPT